MLCIHTMCVHSNNGLFKTYFALPIHCVSPLNVINTHFFEVYFAAVEDHLWERSCSHPLMSLSSPLAVMVVTVSTVSIIQGGHTVTQDYSLSYPSSALLCSFLCLKGRTKSRLHFPRCFLRKGQCTACTR